MLGLPDSARACLFDMDGVLTKTAVVHARAWKEMFDGYLKGRAASTGEPFKPFDARADYDRYVDGKPRSDGVRSFLDSRGISLPEGDAGDPPDAETVAGLGNRKNELVQRLIREGGEHGLRRAVVSSSANTHDVLASAGIADLFEEVVDGILAEREHLRGKPDPDTFLAGARLLGLDAGSAVVFEDSLAGVAAGRAGAFGCVVGVDRVGQADALREHGADLVVSDLADLLPPG
jgi:beta-phosphoglucomutase-like phosphatase (HAD superfamily)